MEPLTGLVVSTGVHCMRQCVFTVIAVVLMFSAGTAHAGEYQEAFAAALDMPIFGEVTGDNVRLREKPSTESNILGKFGTGQKVATMRPVKDNITWVEVVIEGQHGFIHMDYHRPRRGIMK